MTLSQQLVLDGVMSGVFESVFLGLELIAFCSCILQMKFHKSPLRRVTGGLLVIISGVIQGYWESMGCIRIHMLFIDYGFEWPNKTLNSAILIIIQVVLFVGVSLVFNEKILKGMLKVFFCMLSDSVLIMIISDLVLDNIERVFDLQFKGIVYSVIYILLYIAALCCIALVIKRKKELVQCIRDIPVIYYIICIVIYSLCMEIPMYFLDKYSAFDYKVRSDFLKFGVFAADILYTLIFVLIFVNFWLKHYKRENILKNQHLQMLRDYYNGVTGHIREVRSIKHDMRAHMNVLEDYLNADNLERAKSYLSEIKANQSYGSIRVINVGNELVSAVLTEVMQRTENEDIIFECEGMLPSKLPIADFDLCTIFSNIITKSTEACNALKEKEKRITLRIKVLGKNIVITCENPIEGEPDIAKLKGYTSKKDKRSHGYGLYNIEKAVTKYGGEMKLSVEDEKFRLAILLYQITNED